MATLTVQPITRAGIVPAFAAASGGGDKFAPGDDVYLHAKNGSGGALTITVVTPREAIEGVAIADPQVTIAAGAERKWGPFPRGTFANPADSSLASITYSGVTSLTIGAFRLTA